MLRSLRCLLRSLLWLLWSSRNYLYRNNASHKDRNSLGVHCVEHCLEQVERFNLVDQQRIFLFVACILYRLTELVEFTEVFLPCFVNRHKQDSFLPSLGNVRTVAVVGFFQVNSDAVDTFSVGYRNTDKAFATAVFHDVLDNRHCHFRHLLALALECFDSGVENCLCLLFGREFLVFFFVERQFDGKSLEDIHLQFLIVGLSAVRVDDVFNRIVNHVHDIDTDTFTHQCVVAA